MILSLFQVRILFVLVNIIDLIYWEVTLQNLVVQSIGAIRTSRERDESSEFVNDNIAVGDEDAAIWPNWSDAIPIRVDS